MDKVPWPVDRVERRALAALIPYAQNARTHSDEQIEQIVRSIREWGWTMPVLIDDAGGIIAGHARVMAARRLGIAEVPCIVATGWTDAQRRAYVLADNQLALNAGWDLELLRVEINGLGSLGFDLGLAGFTSAGLDGLFAAGTPPADPAATLAERFGVAPFSVLNAREGWWQERKAAWLALGIQSEIGRGENLLQFSDTILEPDAAKRRAAVPGNAGHPASASYNPDFYKQKRDKEAELGRSLTTAEFRKEFWGAA